MQKERQGRSFFMVDLACVGCHVMRRALFVWNSGIHNRPHHFDTNLGSGNGDILGCYRRADGGIGHCPSGAYGNSAYGVNNGQYGTAWQSCTEDKRQIHHGFGMLHKECFIGKKI
jgi:hypothetical protein